jgi:hypothetical protein
MHMPAIAPRRIQDFETHVAALLRRGAVLGKAGQCEEAGRLLRAAVAGRLDTDTLLALSFLHWRRGDAQAAELAYGAAARLAGAPLPASIELYQGIYAGQAGAVTEAEQHLRLCLALSPGQPEAAYALGSLLAARGRFAEADAFFSAGLPVMCGDGRFTTTHMLRLPVPGRPLGWPVPTAPCPSRSVALPLAITAAGADMVYLIAADSRYIGLFARPLATSIQRAGSGRVLLHVHCVNPDAAAIALLEELRNGPIPLAVSTEQAALGGMDEMERRCFYASARYLVLPDLLATYGLPVLVADADQVALRPPVAMLPLLGDADVALLRFKNTEYNILSLVSATLMLVGAGPGGRRFADTLRAWLVARMAEDKCLAWHLDQAALAVVLLGLEGLRWVGLNPALVHLEPQPPSAGSPAAFWSITHSIAANAAKLETSAFRALAGGEISRPSPPVPPSAELFMTGDEG